MSLWCSVALRMSYALKTLVCLNVKLLLMSHDGWDQRCPLAAAAAAVIAALRLCCAQEGVFRTNCVDCLDRTNVVQGLLARHALEDLLTELGVLQAGESLHSVLPEVGEEGVGVGVGQRGALPALGGPQARCVACCYVCTRCIWHPGSCRSTSTLPGAGTSGIISR
jgi:hypothetical protein